jgi:general secretion pathway protein G
LTGRTFNEKARWLLAASRTHLLSPRKAVGSLMAARRRCRARYGWGFTLIELMLVIAIIGTLTSIATPKLMEAVSQARIAHAIGDIQAVMTAIDGSDTPPGSLADVGYGGMLDPWGNPYGYLWHGGAKGAAKKDRFQVPLNSEYDLWSSGEDGSTAQALTAAAAKDDIVRANDGGYVGLGSKY